MKEKIKKIITVLIITVPLNFSMVFAHPGRTDSNGGHKDKNNVSGLGAYHYHCGGNPAHLHENGVCPYSNTSSGSSTTNNSSSSDSSSNSSSSDSSSTTAQQAAIEKAKKEANDEGYSAGYKAACNGEEFNDNNSSTYSTEYKSGYSNGYNAGNEYIEQNTDTYIKYAEEDACNFKMRDFTEDVPSVLKSKYIYAYNNKVDNLKELAYNAGYQQAISENEADLSNFKNQEEINKYNEGYEEGNANLESEKNKAYEAGRNGNEYYVPENLSAAEKVLVSAYKEGEEIHKQENKKKAVTAGAVLVTASAVGSAVVIKKKKVQK